MNNSVKAKTIDAVISVHIVTKSVLEQYLQQNIHLKEIFDMYSFEGSYKETLFLPESKIVYVGATLKSRTQHTDPYNKIDYFELGATIANTLSKTRINSYNIESLPIDTSKEQIKHLILGMKQGAWEFDMYKNPSSSKNKELNIKLSTELDIFLDDEDIKEMKIFHDGLILTRSLVEDIPEEINPSTIARIVQSHFGGFENVRIQEFGYLDLEEMGMNAINAVGRGSDHKPILTHVTISPSGGVKKRICLVGKGLTYDSGGLDIKTEGYMKTMKTDMAGSSTMFGVAKIITELGLMHTEVHWISAFAENMIGPNSYKSDDIITTYSGQTVEVHNTDAEGRLTLADALSYATLQDPDYIIDAATLTGACIQALSDYYTGLMGNDADLIRQLTDIFRSEGERTMYVEMPEVLRPWVQGSIADLINTSTGKRAGHITAGLFLSHFVDQRLFRNSKLTIDEPKSYPWVHLDIAGSSYNDSRNSLSKQGATGQGVRGIVKWIQTIDQNA